MPMSGAPPSAIAIGTDDLEALIGEVQASPTENTLLERSKAIETALTAINTLIGAIATSPTENTLLERQKAIETVITATNTIMGAVTASPTQYTVNERLKVLDASTQALLTTLGLVASSPASNTMQDRLKQIEAGIDEVKVLIGAVTGSPTENTVLERLKTLESTIVLATGTNNIGDVDILSVVPGTAATNLGKAEDAQHATGDVGIMALAVRKDKHEAIAGADGDYSPHQLDKYGGVRHAEWEVGPIELRADNEGWALWEKVARNAKYIYGTDLNRQFRQGPWAVHLNGGEQSSGEDWASVHIPVNEIKITDLDEFMFTYYKFLSGTDDLGIWAPNIVISVHDPTNHDARADINIYAVNAGAVTAGWHETIMNSATTAMFYWGNNVGSPDTCTTQGGAGYTWAQYQADSVFSTWTVYRIGIDYGFWGGARSTGDVWVGSIQINDIPVKMEPADRNDIGTRKSFSEPTFGEPTLQAVRNSDAVWSRGALDPLYQKGATGWLANLYGGVQSGDDFAAINIPVNELPVPLFNTARWSYYMSATETMGINMVIHVHDPYDHDIRAEITQMANIATLEKGAGWNAHELNQTTDQFYYYGEGISGTSLITGAGPGNLFGWDDFQGDERFNTMVIYRISFEYGWEASGTFDDAWVADIVLNNQQIPLKPDSGGTGRIGHRHFTCVSGDLTGALAPKTPFQLLSVRGYVSATPNATELFTITLDAGQDTLYDAVIYSNDLGTNALTSWVEVFEGELVFGADDELDVFHTNSQNDDYGVTLTYRTVFA